MRLVLLACAVAAAPALAHDGVTHGSAREAAEHSAASIDGPGVPFPVALGGSFELTDQTGARRTEADPQARMQLLFFGYANCKSICSVALPLMARVAEATAARGVELSPVMITVDPARDTVETMGKALSVHSPDFTGLTGTEAELAAVYDAYSVEHKVVFEDPEHGPIFAHGSHIYLLDPEGEVLTLLPPILSEERLTEIVMGYAAADGVN